MPYDLDNRLVVGIASSALFDLKESDAIFRRKGQEAYSQYQRERRHSTLPKGVAFPFIERLLSLNNLRDAENPLVEVIIISKNDTSSGVRVRNSVKDHSLPISRMSFLKGKSPSPYIRTFKCELFLSADSRDVVSAIEDGLPAGQVLEMKSDVAQDETTELRVAFDFDGVIADDEAERIYAERDLLTFRQHEKDRANEPMQPGPLAPLLQRLSDIQRIEKDLIRTSKKYKQRLWTSIVTARDAPADERAIHTLESWGVDVDQAHFLGGIDKSPILEVIKPHMFFDDQINNLKNSAQTIPSVHIPFGIRNQE